MSQDAQHPALTPEGFGEALGVQAAYTAAEEWVVDEPEQLVLPSGNRVLVKKPNLLTMLAKGEIPNPLVAVVEGMFALEDEEEIRARAKREGRTYEEQILHDLEEKTRERDASEADGGESEPGPEQQQRRGAASEHIAFVDLMVYAAVLAPKLTLDSPVTPGGKLAEDGSLCLNAIDDMDKLAIVEWCNKDLETVRSFPGERSGDRGEPGSGEVRAEAERPAGDPGGDEHSVAPVLP